MKFTEIVSGTTENLVKILDEMEVNGKLRSVDASFKTHQFKLPEIVYLVHWKGSRRDYKKLQKAGKELMKGWTR